MNKKINLGRVAYVPKGAYDSNTTYGRLHCVTYKNTTYWSKQEGNTGNEPNGETEWWGVLVDGQAAYEATATAHEATVAANNAAASATVAAEKAETASEKANEATESVKQVVKDAQNATAEANGSASASATAAQRADAAATKSEALNLRMENDLNGIEQTKKNFDALNETATANENTRTEAEAVRNENETLRQSTEQDRVLTEQTRKTNEVERKTSETLRANAETARAEAERKRVEAETARIGTFKDTIESAQEATYAAQTAAQTAMLGASRVNEAVDAASNVDATLDENNILTVTDRHGNSNSVNLGEGDKVKQLVKDVDRVQQSLGHYSPRPDVTLTPSEQNVAISSDGVKVQKQGWAIAEFTAEKGNEYLFKPNTIDGSVCLFAERIDKVETRSIDYTYTYNEEDGTVATATATYLGKTHTYNYTYTTDENGMEVTTITDDTGAVFADLPYQYQTTVGSFSPLVRLNADAELPTDGYCRFMSHFQGNNALKVVVSYKVGTADLTMKVLRDGVFASISTQLGNLSQKENETRSIAVDLKQKVDQFVGTNQYVGFARMNGDASPDAEITFGDKALLHEVGAEWKLATVKNGTVTHVMAPGRLTLDENGAEVKIDGSEGDVMLINRHCHLLKTTQNIDGREMNAIAIGKTHARWYSAESKQLPPFGFTPCETVNAKIFDDVRSQAHCVYNKEAIGKHIAQSATIFKNTYKTSGGGYMSASISAIESIRQAQNKNADELTARPYMGWYYETYEALITMMFSELGSLRHTSADVFGVGITQTYIGSLSNHYNNEAISGNSCFKLITASGEELYANLNLQVFVSSKNYNTYMYSDIIKGYYTFIEMLEGQRILDAIAKANLIDKIGSKDNVFYYDENGNAVCASDGSVNLDTGEGMEACKFYYLVRNVPKCEGMKDGVMTAVVNRYVKLEFADGIMTTDKKTSFDGGIAIMKLSIPIYRGFTLLYDAYFRQVSYAYYTVHNNNGELSADFRCAERMEDVQPLKVFDQTAYTSDFGVAPPLVEHLSLKKTDHIPNHTGATVKSADYNYSLLCYTETGGALTTYENAYLFMPWSQNGGVGKSQTHGSVVGCHYDGNLASVRTAYCYYGAGYSYSSYAGAFAVLLNP